MAELLALLPLVQLPHHAFFSGHPLVSGHTKVTKTVVGVLVVTRQVAGHWGGTASGVVASGLWQRLVRIHHDGLRLERRRPSG